MSFIGIFVPTAAVVLYSLGTNIGKKGGIMDKPLVELCVEVVTAQLQSQGMQSQEIAESIWTIHRTLRALQGADHQNGAPPGEGHDDALTILRRNPFQSLQKKTVTCLECGRQFMLLSNRHLAVHDLTPKTYKGKWGIALTTPLSSQNLTSRRRKLAKEMNAGKELAAWRATRTKRLAG